MDNRDRARTKSMTEGQGKLDDLPRRLLLDTCVINRIFDEGAYIFEGELPDGFDGQEDPNNEALRGIFAVNVRAQFELLVSPLSVSEVANIQDFSDRQVRLRWLLEMLDHWLIMLDERQARVTQGGTVRHRFKLTPDLQAFETALMEIPDFRRDPFDRLLLVQYRMGACQAFITTDRDTIWRRRASLQELGVLVLTPAEYWQMMLPWAALFL
jgi:hypothetical protein